VSHPACETCTASCSNYKDEQLAGKRWKEAQYIGHKEIAMQSFRCRCPRQQSKQSTCPQPGNVFLLLLLPNKLANCLIHRSCQTGLGYSLLLFRPAQQGFTAKSLNHMVICRQYSLFSLWPCMRQPANAIPRAPKISSFSWCL